MVQLPLVINKSVWRKLPPDLQAILKEEAERVIDNRAFELREQWHREGVEGNVAKGMEQIPLSPEIQASVKEVLRSRVVPAWVQRAGGQEAARLFNEIVGPHAGFTVAQ
jgi:TRAP-type C4-dicarboxylate transport system substrate-binding protein